MCPLAPKARLAQRWSWPIDLSRYDCSPGLQATKAGQLHELLERFDRGATTWPHGGRENLARLLQPLNDTLQFTGASGWTRAGVITLLFRQMDRRETTFWGWDRREWCSILVSRPGSAC